MGQEVRKKLEEIRVLRKILIYIARNDSSRERKQIFNISFFDMSTLVAEIIDDPDISDSCSLRGIYITENLW